MRDTTKILIGCEFEMHPLLGCDIRAAAEAAVLARQLCSRVRSFSFNDINVRIRDEDTAETLTRRYHDAIKKP